MKWDSSPACDDASPGETACGGPTLERFLDREFDGEPGLAAEYPLLVGAGNAERRWVARIGGEIAAHVAWRPLRLRSYGRSLRAAGIGLVTTGRRWRGRGLAGQGVEHCLAAARAEGAEIALLFGEPRSLYRRAGFVPAGRERVVPLPAHQSPRPSKLRARLGTPSDAARLLPLLAAHPLGVERSCEEFQALLSIPRTELWLLQGPDSLRAYAVCGKGRDLVGVAHEWGGDPEAVAELLGELAGTRAQVALAPDPAGIPALGPGHLGPLAQIRILAPERLGTDDPLRLFGDAETPAEIPLYVWGLDSV
ncbi:MAG: GNAT family N-acetyltransferase [Myxococcota bacterium]